MNQGVQNTVKICLILFLGGAFVYYYHRYNPSVNSQQFLSCPSYQFLGIFCPGCGTQRMIHHLLHFELGQAFRYNPLLFLSFPFVLYLVYVLIANTFFGKSYRVKILYKNWFVYLIFGILILYTLLRNLPYQQLEIFQPPG